MSKSNIINQIEETLIAIILGLMTLVTFANVVARYVFDSNILWALQTTVFLFAWLVLIGVSYCVKITAHLGIDLVLNMVSPKMRRLMTIAAVASCIIFSLLLQGQLGLLVAICIQKCLVRDRRYSDAGVFKIY